MIKGLARVAHQRAVGRAVAECGPYVSEKTPFLLASPDGVVVNTDGNHEGFVELKVTGSGEPAPITDSYLLQCVLHCYCGELLWCDFVSFGNNKLLVQRVRYEGQWVNDEKCGEGVREIAKVAGIRTLYLQHIYLYLWLF